MSGLLITNVRIDGPLPVDVRVQGSRIAAIAPSLRPHSGDRVLEGRGGTLIPGLHDHHIHLRALAARIASVEAGPPHVVDAVQLADSLAAAARSQAGAGGGWVRAVGYHESVAGPLDRDDLDRIVPSVPVRVQHRSGAMWILNTAAIRELGLEQRGADGIERDAAGRVTGRLWRADALLRDVAPPVDGDLHAVGVRAAAAGITGFTDTDPDRTLPDLVALRDALPQRVLAMGPVGLRAAAIDVEDEFIRVGPVKVLLDDDSLPPVDDLTDRIAAAHSEGRAAAVHCVTRSQVIIAMLAMESAGPFAGDRIEHAAVVPDELIDGMRGLGVTVVTQPNFIYERGDEYLDDVEPDDHDLLYRCGSLLAAGIPVAAGTDAPFGDADPWAAMHAAVHRRTRRGVALGTRERVDASGALELFLGHPDAPGRPRRVEPGAVADLCLLTMPGPRAVESGDRSAVAATIIDGNVVFEGS